MVAGFLTMRLLPQWNGQNDASQYAPVARRFVSQEIEVPKAPRPIRSDSSGIRFLLDIPHMYV
jgi:hypothetical protein